MSNRFLKQLSKWPDYISTGMHGLAASMMFIMVFLATGDVVGRALFNRPIPGVPEIIKVSLVFICFLLLPEATRSLHHIRSEILVDRMSPAWARRMAMVRFFLGAVIMIGIAVATWDKMIEAWKIWEYEGEGTIRIPMFPVRAAILICSSLGAFFSLRLLRKTLKGSHVKP
jgi:TRAP-type C4-dicarboxylate transport system permease small subunit